jgi:hypothetical protein
MDAPLGWWYDVLTFALSRVRRPAGRSHFRLWTVRSESAIKRDLCRTARAWRQPNPRMPAAFVDGKSRRWKATVTKRIHGYAHRLLVTVFGLEDGGTTVV